MSYICCVDICCLVINVSSGLHGLILTKVGGGGGRGGEGRGGEGEEDELEVDTFQQFPKLLEYSDEAVQKILKSTCESKTSQLLSPIDQ